MPRTPPPRWTRDNRMLLALGTALGGALTGLYALALRARSLTPAAATNRILLFALLYVVVLLLLVLLFVLVRAGAKLLIESRKGVFGSRFRVRIVTTHVGLALLPIALLVLPTTGLLQRSVDFWFQPPVQDTMRAGRAVVDLVRERGAANERRAAARLEAGLSSARSDDERLALFGTIRETYGLDLVELRPESEGVPALAVTSPRWPVREVRDPGPEWIADARARGLSRRIEPLSSGGQIARTLVPVPGGTLVLSSYDPPAEAASLRDLSRATSTYAMLEAERSSLEALQLLFFLLLAFLVLLAAVWAGLLLSRRVTRPIGQLVESARRVGEGDFEALVEVEGGDEIARLSGAFNEMT
ncbi:MAG: HAMP domain-containing protein, partial [Acidobacteria bacterium]|nr:HAMP domain-containing protein [Acidobacteriota bacterium]